MESLVKVVIFNLLGVLRLSINSRILSGTFKATRQ